MWRKNSNSMSCLLKCATKTSFTMVLLKILCISLSVSVAGHSEISSTDLKFRNFFKKPANYLIYTTNRTNDNALKSADVPNPNLPSKISVNKLNDSRGLSFFKYGKVRSKELNSAKIYSKCTEEEEAFLKKFAESDERFMHFLGLRNFFNHLTPQNECLSQNKIGEYSKNNETTRNNADYFSNTSKPDLPECCLFQESTSNPLYVNILCEGDFIQELPNLSHVKNVNTLTFVNTNIQIIDESAVLNIPADLSQLTFKNGQICRIHLNSLLKILSKLKKLTFERNYVTTLHFLTMETQFLHECQLKTLDLRCNTINNLVRQPERNIDLTALLENLEVLILSGNSLKVLPGDIFWSRRKSKLKALHLDSTGIIDFGRPTFTESKSPLAYLTELEELNLSNNHHLSLDKVTTLIEPFRKGNLKTLKLDYNYYRYIPTELLQYVNHSLRNMSLVESNFMSILSRDFPIMKKLILLNLKQCRIRTIKSDAFKNLPNLRALNLNGNELASLSSSWLNLPNLQYLSVDGNSRESLDFTFQIEESAFKHLPNLEYLSIQKVSLKKIENTTFQFLSKLFHLNLKFCDLQTIAPNSFKCLQDLWYLSLRHNELKNISLPIFRGLFNLYILDLSHNMISLYPRQADYSADHYLFQSPTEENIHPLFKYLMPTLNRDITSNYNRGRTPFLGLNKLTFLLIKNNKLDIMIPNYFTQFTDLKMIDMRANRIKEWHEPLFKHLTKLTNINLAENNIEKITEAMIEDFRNKKSVNLNKNLFECNCSLTVLYEDLNTTGIIPARDKLTCLLGSELVSVLSYLNKTGNCDATEHRKKRSQQEKYVAVAIFGGLVLLGFSIFTATYRNRWYMKYLAYKLKLRYVVRDDCRANYEYDIFICYAHTERQWVFERLIDKLESKNNSLRVCVHERDFLVGEDITKNIIHSVEISRKVLVVISRAFVQSTWCMFELQMASNKIIDERQNKLILIILEPIPQSIQPKELKILLKSRTYISWPVEMHGEMVFWERLERAIAKPTNINEVFNSNDLNYTSSDPENGITRINQLRDSSTSNILNQSNLQNNLGIKNYSSTIFNQKRLENSLNSSRSSPPNLFDTNKLENSLNRQSTKLYSNNILDARLDNCPNEKSSINLYSNTILDPSKLQNSIS